MISWPVSLKGKVTKDQAGLEDIGEVLDRIANFSLLAIAVLGLPTIVATTYRTVDIGWRPVFCYFLAMYCFLLLVTFFRRKISYQARASIIIVIIAVSGAVGIQNFGLIGTGPLFLLGSCALGTVFFGFRGGIIVTTLCTIFFSLLGIAVHFKVIVFDFDVATFSTSLSCWLSGIFSWLTLSMVIVITLGWLHGSLKDSIFRLSDKAARLKDANDELLREIEHREKVEEKYRLLVENAIDAIAIVQEGKVVYTNPSALIMLGYGSDEILGTTFTDIIHPDDKTIALMHYDERLVKQFPGEHFYRVLTKKGDVLTAGVNGVAIEWEGRAALMIMARDITRQLAMEKELERKERLGAIGTLASGIAHDFNNLLMGIQGNSSLIGLSLQPTDKACERVQNIEEYVKEGSRLTNQLLSFAKGAKCEMKPTDISDLVEKTAYMFGRTHKEITVHMNLEALACADADKGQIEQVLMNLYLNAWQAMPKGGEIILVTSNIIFSSETESPVPGIGSGRYVKISVRDTGVGMTPEVMEKIFDPFFTTKNRSRGTGMGLASALSIVHSHGGVIAVTSSVNGGSTFDVYLKASTVPCEPAKEDDATLVFGTETVLWVDDEANILETNAELLKTLGYSVIIAGSVDEALQAYKGNRERIALMILDMVMPNGGGAEVFRCVKDENPGARILLCSGYGAGDADFEMLAEACDSFIQKPFDLVSISRKVREILG